MTKLLCNAWALPKKLVDFKVLAKSVSHLLSTGDTKTIPHLDSIPPTDLWNFDRFGQRVGTTHMRQARLDEDGDAKVKWVAYAGPADVGKSDSDGNLSHKTILLGRLALQQIRDNRAGTGNTR